MLRRIGQLSIELIETRKKYQREIEELKEENLIRETELKKELELVKKRLEDETKLKEEAERIQRKLSEDLPGYYHDARRSGFNEGYAKGIFQQKFGKYKIDERGLRIPT